MKLCGSFVLALVLTATAGCEIAKQADAPVSSHRDVEQQIVRILDGWHAAAARADEAAYFGAFAPNAIFMGTDATEHWDLPAFHEFARPFFARGKAWNFKATRRLVTMSTGGDVAWFDEDLDTPNLGPARGSGVLVRHGATFKIAQYNLSVPIPNDRLGAVRGLIAAPSGPPKVQSSP